MITFFVTTNKDYLHLKTKAIRHNTHSHTRIIRISLTSCFSEQIKYSDSIVAPFNLNVFYFCDKCIIDAPVSSIY